MNRFVIMIISGLVVGCVTPPQTVDELREGVRGGAAFKKMERQEVNRSFNKTVESVKKNADRCLNVTIRSTTPGTYGPMIEPIRYRSNSNKTGLKTAEMVLKQNARGTGKMLDGGYFVTLTDIVVDDSNKTKITIYGGSMGYDNVYDSILAWARGKKINCPKFPMGGSRNSYTYQEN